MTVLLSNVVEFVFLRWIEMKKKGRPPPFTVSERLVFLSPLVPSCVLGHVYLGLPPPLSLLHSYSVIFWEYAQHFFSLNIAYFTYQK